MKRLSRRRRAHVVVAFVKVMANKLQVAVLASLALGLNQAALEAEHSLGL